MKRSDLPPHKTATFVLPRLKVVYVSVPKAACTSVKWLVADLQGESRERFHNTVSTETTREMTIHRRSRWQYTPMLHQLSDEELEEISAENGWFVFAVVRHPAARLWSGWQSKLLLKEPRFVKNYPDLPWPGIPASTSDVVSDFQSFVRVLEADPDQPILRDRHFLSQTKLLRIGVTPYSRIYQTSEIPQLLDDLERHIKRFGHEQMPELSRVNETPLPMIPPLFSDETEKIIASHYADDYENLGYDAVLPDVFEARGEYSPSELAEVDRLVDRAERISDLVDIATTLQKKKRTAEAEADALRAQLSPVRSTGLSGSLRLAMRRLALLSQRRL